MFPTVRSHCTESIQYTSNNSGLSKQFTRRPSFLSVQPIVYCVPFVDLNGWQIIGVDERRSSKRNSLINRGKYIVFYFYCTFYFYRLYTLFKIHLIVYEINTFMNLAIAFKRESVELSIFRFLLINKHTFFYFFKLFSSSDNTN